MIRHDVRFRLVFAIILLALNSCTTATPRTTPSPSATLKATSRPAEMIGPTQSPTINFTATATVEPTWTPQPTNTPLVPTPVTGKGYQLTAWTPEKAEQLIAELKNYPETLGIFDRGYLDSFYYVAFKYAGLAELESALRFPQSQKVQEWQFDGAYHQYQSSSDDATQLYAGLIANAMNQKITNLQDFESWFAQTIPFQLRIHVVTPPKGYQKSMVLHLFKDWTNKPFTGGFAIWLLQLEGNFFSYPLTNAWEIAYGEGYSTAGTVDLSGDGIVEAIVQNSDWGSFGMHSGELAIYRLDQVPPQKNSFDALPPDPSIAEWFVDQSEPVPTITFQVRVSTTSDMPCGSFSAGWQYRWKDNELKFVRFVPPSMEEMEQNPVCTRLMVSSLGSPEYLKNSTALETYKQLLNLPFIAKIDLGRGDPWLIEDERFFLARFLAEIGDEAGAAEQIQLIKNSTEPTIVEWREHAMAYFAARNDPQALLQLCLTSQKCFLDWIEKIALVPSSRFSEIDKLLQQMGINFHSSGEYDFDQDGQVEKWLLFRNTTGCGNGFWILSKNDERIISRSIVDLCLPDDVQNDEKVKIHSLPPVGGLQAYEVFVVGEEQNAEKFLYWPMDQQDPTVDSGRAGHMIDTIQNQLMLGQISPAQAQIELQHILNLPLQPNRWLPSIHAQLLYLLGLTHELNGKNSQAAQTYLELWQTFPDNPYAVMAYAKLEPAK